MLVGAFLLNLIEKHHMLALNLCLFLIVHLEGEFLGFLAAHYLNIGHLWEPELWQEPPILWTATIRQSFWALMSLPETVWIPYQTEIM